MDFADKILDFSTKIEPMLKSITSEEATKTSIVLPFFQLLGYDVFNPLEFIPEYTADTGTKKGEKVNYAIVQNQNPLMIIEVKPANVELNSKHLNQLFRYFTVTKARFGILTNGIVYKFYSDIEEINKMDLIPFLEINLLDIKESGLQELKKFQKENFNTKEILDSASELKYTSLLKTALSEQLQNPSEQFVRALIKNIYAGIKTQAVIDKFRELLKVAIDEYINELMNDKFKNAITQPSRKEPPHQKPATPDFLKEELETLDFVKDMLHLDDGVSYKKTSRYAYMHISDSSSKWICRIAVMKDKKLFTLHKFDSTDYETEYYFDDVELLGQIENLILDTYSKCQQI